MLCRARSMRIAGCLPVVLFLLSGANAFAADEPTAEEIERLLAAESFTVERWPVWRERLLNWIDGDKEILRPAFDAARAFVLAESGEHAQLEPPLADDAFAWYLLGSAQIYDSVGEPNPAARANAAVLSLQESLKRDAEFARSHRYLALAHLMRSKSANDVMAREADKALQRARELDPRLPVEWVPAAAFTMSGQFARAVRHWRKAITEEPHESGYAVGLSQCLLASWKPGDRPLGPEIETLVDRFPEDGALRCFFAAGLAQDGDFERAIEELDRARERGTDPDEILGAETVDQIVTLAQPSLATRLGRGAVWFALVYGSVMIAMGAFAWVMAAFTRGTKVTHLTGGESVEVVQTGRVVRTGDETLLARMYSLALVAGLVLFYIAVPFVILGLLGGTAGLLYLILMTGRVPVKLFIIILVVGLAMAWSVVKSLFTRSSDEGFGISKTPDEEPRLHQLLADVAQRVDTDAVDDVYIGPGAGIGVHQTGRGPFGLFGVKNRVLTLGLSSLQFLNVDELRSILAHEYAHFSHGDTFFSRFIYQVKMSIESSLQGMGEAGGVMNYVNPFYWFMYLYYRSYSMMAAGFSRSREFLADRMAVALYGADVFGCAMMRVATRGS